MPRDPFASNAGHFKKGHDPRRHIFTPEDCKKGWESAAESVRSILRDNFGREPTEEEVFNTVSRIVTKKMRYRELDQ